MKQGALTALIGVAAAWLLVAVDRPAVAQTADPPQANAPAPPAEPNPEAPLPSSPLQPASPPRQAAVLLITSVEVLHSSHPPELDIIRVRGLTSTSGWMEPNLEPLTEGVPPDGILDLVLVADAPTSTPPMGFSPIATLFPLQSGHPYKGVRVRGAENAITLTSMPGYQPARINVNDCSQCLGKFFVATGQPAPTGKAEVEIVRQENLPSSLRIIKPTDGVAPDAPTEGNPNRLTVVLGADGRIVNVAWY